MEYAIVDIETTGGAPKNGGITEIAILIHDGESIIQEYETLLNPEQGIPTYITGLTGIDNFMVRHKPKFSDIKDELWDLLHNRVFVAHNVNFDYSFLREAFLKEGLDFKVPKLCTVRLSRKVFPGLRSYSLGRLCENQNIPIEARHRAMGDARATTILFDRMMKSGTQVVEEAMKKNMGQSYLPPNFPLSKFKDIPQSCGVYYMLDVNGRVLYVGKAINIRERFKSHFTGDVLPNLKQKLKSEVVDLKWELTGSEFFALLLESLEIKRLWPKYNLALKLPKTMYGLFYYEDNLGYGRFQISKVTKHIRPLDTFFSMEEATQYLKEGIQTYSLCPKLCGLRKVDCDESSSLRCDGACQTQQSTAAYNEGVKGFLIKVKDSQKEILIKLEGRTPEEAVFCLFERGILVQYGYASKDLENEAALATLNKVAVVPETYYILRQYIHKLSAAQITVLPSTYKLL